MERITTALELVGLLLLVAAGGWWVAQRAGLPGGVAAGGLGLVLVSAVLVARDAHAARAAQARPVVAPDEAAAL